MKRYLLVSLTFTFLVVSLILTLAACGTPSGVDTDIPGVGSPQYPAAAAAADEAIASIQKSDNIKTYGITSELGVLSVGCDLSSPPLGFRANVTTGTGDNAETSMGNVGFEIDLCKAIAGKLGLELTLPDPGKAQDIVNWKDLPDALLDGKFDVMVSAMKTGEGLEDTFAHTTPHLSADLAIVAAATQTIDSEGSLAGMTVGVQLGSTAERFVADMPVVGEIRTYPHMTAAFADLALGEVDAIIGDHTTCEWIIANDATYTGNYVIHNTIVTGEGYAFWCAKANTALVDAIDAALQELRTAPQAPETTTTTQPASGDTENATTTEASTGSADATTTTTAPPPELKSVYQLICEKWGLEGN